jgi:hypothetical protein
MKYAADHKQLEALLDKLNHMVKNLKAGDSLHYLTQEMMNYEAMILPHLEQEEVECLPLCRAYFTPDEVASVVQKIMSKAPKVELGSFIKCMGVDTFRKDFMRQEHIPWFVWYLSFRCCVKVFEHRFEAPVQALKNGQAPKKGLFA